MKDSHYPWLNYYSNNFGCTSASAFAGITITNTNPTAGFRVEIYESIDAIFDPSDTLVKFRDFAPCVPGACGQVGVNPGDRVSCGRFLIAVIDTQNSVVETNKWNNIVITGTP